MKREMLNLLNIRNFNSRVDLSDLRLLRLAYGAEGLRYFYDCFKGHLPNSDIDNNNFDQIFFENLSREIGEPFTPDRFMDALKKANNTHLRIVESLGLPSWDAGLINNVYAISDKPSKLLRLISSPDTVPLLKYQLSNQLILALIHAHLDARIRNNRPETILSDFVDFTDRVLFRGQPIGENYVVNIFSTHDNTNRVQRLNIGSPFTSLENGELRQKKTPIRVRHSKLGKHKFQFGLDIRKKDDETSVLKILAKATRGNGVIKIEDYVQDIIGAKFVVVEGNVNNLIVTFENLVREHYGDIEIEEDDSVNFDRGQSNRHTFRRRHLHLGGAIIEVIFYSLREFLNSQYDVGEEGIDGFFNGAAHRLYEIKRIVDAASVLFPEDMYGFRVQDYWPLKQKQIVEELFNNNTI